MTIKTPSPMWMDGKKVWILRCPHCQLFYGARKKRIYCERSCQNKAFYERKKSFRV